MDGGDKKCAMGGKGGLLVLVFEGGRGLNDALSVYG